MANFYNVKVSDKISNADTETTELFKDELHHVPEKIFNVDETNLFRKHISSVRVCFMSRHLGQVLWALKKISLHMNAVYMHSKTMPVFTVCVTLLLGV